MNGLKTRFVEFLLAHNSLMVSKKWPTQTGSTGAPRAHLTEILTKIHKIELSNYDQYALKGRTLLVFKACQPPSTFVLCNFIILVIIAIIFITIIIIMTWTREWEWFYLQISCYYDDEVIKNKSSPSWTWRSTINHNYYMLSQTKTSQLLSNV